MESGTEHPGSGPQDAAGEATLSVAQEHLWCLEQFAAGKPINNIATVLKIKGAFDVVALERAVAHYVQQHPILRTVVENREGRPVARRLHSEMGACRASSKMIAASTFGRGPSARWRRLGAIR